MDGTGGLTIATGVGVPLVGALVFVAFQHPEFYRKHLQRGMFALPFVLLLLYGLVAGGYLWGSLAQAMVDHPDAAPPAIAWFPLPPWFVLMFFGAFEMLAIGLFYLAQNSPHASQTP